MDKYPTYFVNILIPVKREYRVINISGCLPLANTLERYCNDGFTIDRVDLLPNHHAQASDLIYILSKPISQS